MNLNLSFWQQFHTAEQHFFCMSPQGKMKGKISNHKPSECKQLSKKEKLIKEVGIISVKVTLHLGPSMIKTTWCYISHIVTDSWLQLLFIIVM